MQVQELVGNDAGRERRAVDLGDALMMPEGMRMRVAGRRDGFGRLAARFVFVFFRNGVVRPTGAGIRPIGRMHQARDGRVGRIGDG